MIKPLPLILLFLLVIVPIFDVLAQSSRFVKTVEACENKHEEPKELSMCFDRVKESVDRELQTWINNQTFILEEFSLKTGRKQPLDMFKRSQNNFITFRENNCRWQYLHLSPDISAAPAYKKCYINTTQHRIDELSQINN
ncbi:lysozyme inhibitor LprI family protein [Thalassotalea profundi]|uniref:Lysozyme inhibitor LprI-like N-terminal domain-containing protein n=1 Tax=Thalassotalea profundi TaxID=2036687 RepID=A0ABQ3IPC5_9GAMM|nr:lysozyme inhibitor LprI family protein [Thalassotalea profundi]GHE90419.1 hypothetical protein GCM10011501_19770 [Thalassotalea profundi]